MLFISEVAMFALDVYYNQTYGLGGAGSRHDSNNHSGSGSGNSGSGQGNSYGSGTGGGTDRLTLTAAALPLLFKPYPKYRDPFIDTYRSMGAATAARRSITADRILQWISLAHEA